MITGFVHMQLKKSNLVSQKVLTNQFDNRDQFRDGTDTHISVTHGQPKKFAFLLIASF